MSVLKHLRGCLSKDLLLKKRTSPSVAAVQQLCDGRRALCCSSSSKPVRVRFAPSPTGFIHLGGLRTAFYNYLFARQHPGGRFILRIEDTDQERVVPGSLEAIIDTLRWAGLTPDEGPPGAGGGSYGPYIQSQRADLYRSMINRLLEETDAVYRCFCTPKRLDLLRREAAKNRETIRYDNRCRHLSSEEVAEHLAVDRPFTVRLRLKEGPTTVPDLVYGPVTFDLGKVEGDPVLVKSDGLPTYHFANVVDDHHMAVSHVLRGVEWLGSTPKHLMLYEAFGWPAPAYAHLPLIVNSDGSKLSKRHEHIRIETYREAGYQPAALTTYLTGMGGGFGDAIREGQIHPLPELATAFRLTSVNVNNCRIDEEKLRLLNRAALQGRFHSEDEDQRKGLMEELQGLLLKSSQKEGFELELGQDPAAYLRKVLAWALDGGRVTTLQELATAEEYRFLWTAAARPSWSPVGSLAMEPAVAERCLRATLELLNSQISDVDFADEKQLLARLRAVHQEMLVNSAGDQNQPLKFATFMRLLRFALTNLKAGAPVAETMQLLGRQRSATYLERALQYVVVSGGGQSLEDISEKKTSSVESSSSSRS